MLSSLTQVISKMPTLHLRHVYSLTKIAGSTHCKMQGTLTIRKPVEPRSGHIQTLTAGIFDVDGVLLASPHEKAWRETLDGFADRDRSPPQCISPTSRASRA